MPELDAARRDLGQVMEQGEPPERAYATWYLGSPRPRPRPWPTAAASAAVEVLVHAGGQAGHAVRVHGPIDRLRAQCRAFARETAGDRERRILGVETGLDPASEFRISLEPRAPPALAVTESPVLGLRRSVLVPATVAL